MILTQGQFSKRQQNNQLRIALIGMSNIGKSHWTRQIQQAHSFHSYEVDQAIQEQLNLPSIQASAQWMGYPYESEYAQKVEKYLRLEANLTLGAAKFKGNLVLDTTGSIIHLPAKILSQVKEKYLIVYINAEPENIDILVSRFKSSPKPLIWGQHYKQHANLSPKDSLFKCYPSLLLARENLYENLADVSLLSGQLKNSLNTDFLHMLKDALPVSAV